MEITQEYLQDKYDYNPENDTLIFKYNPRRGEDWNNRFVGKEVKPTLSAGKRYIFVCDALYSYQQIINIWEGENRRLTKKTIYDLNIENRKFVAGLSELPVEELKNVASDMLKGNLDVIGLVKRVKHATNLKQIKQAQPKARNTQLGAKNLAPNKTVSDYFDVNNVATVQSTGLPSNIYLHPATKKFYVKITYMGNSHRRCGFNTLNEAFAIRNEIYNQLIEAEKQGVDLATFKVNVDKKERNPPKRQVIFDSAAINPKTNLPNHIYLNKNTGKYRVMITYKGDDYYRGADTYEEALRKRNELYEVLNNGSANNTRD